MGVKLVALSMDKLDSLPMSPQLKQAIIDAKSLRSHGAIRRQAQLIGKLMRTDQSDDLLDAYQALLAEDSAQTAGFHEVEQWRDRLINEGKEVLTEFIDSYPMADAQQLRQLIKKAVDEHKSERHTGSAKALFRYVRSCLE